jgi:hypothetical protein
MLLIESAGPTTMASPLPGVTSGTLSCNAAAILSALIPQMTTVR